MLRFPLKEVWEAKRCKPEQLIVVERGMTPADCEYYERIGWDKYRAGDLIETKLPELGDGLYFSGKFSVHEPRGVVVEIKGKRYKVSFSEDYHYEPWKVQGKFVNFEPTDEPLSVPDRPAPDPYHRGWHYLKFFGQRGSRIKAFLFTGHITHYPDGVLCGIGKVHLRRTSIIGYKYKHNFLYNTLL